jgi:hypothetical protein
LSDTLIRIILVVAVVLALAYNIYNRFRRQMKSPLGRVISIHSNVKKNEKLVDNFTFHRGVEKLKTDAWTKNKDKIDFLPQELRTSLSQTFGMCEEVNGKIEDARKYKSDSYMSGVDVSKLKEPLAKSRLQIKEWVQENMMNPEYSPKKRRGLFG